MGKRRVYKRGPIQAVSDWQELTEEERIKYGQQAKAKAEPDALAKALAKAQTDANERFGG